MARYRILRWRDIPAQIHAWDEQDEAKASLPPAYQEAIDRTAMREGAMESGAYLEGWAWSEEAELDGTPEEVARRVLARILEEEPPPR